MKNWCKIFKLKKYHVLLIIGYSDEDKDHLMLMCRTADVDFRRVVSFDSKEEAQDMFDAYEKKHAEDFIVEFEKLLKDEQSGTTES